MLGSGGPAAGDNVVQERSEAEPDDAAAEGIGAWDVAVSQLRQPGGPGHVPVLRERAAQERAGNCVTDLGR